MHISSLLTPSLTESLVKKMLRHNAKGCYGGEIMHIHVHVCNKAAAT